MIRAAVYPRYSTDKHQSVSASRADRAGYQSMLADAKAAKFDVLLIDNIARVSRDQVEAETTFRRLEHWGVRVIGVSDGYDSEAKTHKVHRAVKN